MYRLSSWSRTPVGTLGGLRPLPLVASGLHAEGGGDVVDSEVCGELETL